MLCLPVKIPECCGCVVRICYSWTSTLPGFSRAVIGTGNRLLWPWKETILCEARDSTELEHCGRRIDPVTCGTDNVIWDVIWCSSRIVLVFLEMRRNRGWRQSALSRMKIDLITLKYIGYCRKLEVRDRADYAALQRNRSCRQNVSDCMRSGLGNVRIYPAIQSRHGADRSMLCGDRQELGPCMVV